MRCFSLVYFLIEDCLKEIVIIFCYHLPFQTVANAVSCTPTDLRIVFCGNISTVFMCVPYFC